MIPSGGRDSIVCWVRSNRWASRSLSAGSCDSIRAIWGSGGSLTSSERM
jgi:hypothetical protein